MFQALQEMNENQKKIIEHHEKKEASITYKIKSNYNNFISSNNLENSKSYD